MPGTPWTPDELRLLEELSEAGIDPQAIADSGKLPGRSKNAIVKMRGRTDLVDPTHSTRTRDGIRGALRGKRRERYFEFLKSPEAAALSSTEIAERWRLKPRTVRQHREELKLTPAYETVASDTKQRQAESAKRRHAERQEIEEVERRKLQIRLEREGCTLPKQQCSDCSDSFFKTEMFFAKVRSVRDGKVFYYLSKRCLTCASRKAAEKWALYRRQRKRKREESEGE